MKSYYRIFILVFLFFVSVRFDLFSQPNIVIDGSYSPCPSALGANDGEWDNPAVHKIVNPDASTTCDFTTIYGYTDENLFYGA